MQFLILICLMLESMLSSLSLSLHLCLNLTPFSHFTLNYFSENTFLI